MTEPNAAQDQQGQGQDDQQPAPEPKKNTVQERISKLYGQLQEERENRTAADAENEQLRTQLLQLQEEVNVIKATAPAIPPTTFGAPAVVQQNSGDADIKNLVAEAVREAVGPISETFEQQRRQQELIAQRRQSLQKALAAFPELADPNSELYQATDQVMRQDRRLHDDPDAPFRAAMIARGFLSEHGQGQAAQPMPQQRAAAVSPPVGTGPNPSPKKEDADVVRTQLEETRKQLREADEGLERQRLWVEVNKLRRKLAGLVQDQ